MSKTPEQPPESHEEEGVSLDQLGQAFAQAMGKRTESSDGEPTDVPLEAEPDVEVFAEPPEIDENPEDDDPCELCPRTILEAMLFIGNPDNEPISASRAAGLMRGVDSEEIVELVEELNQCYAADGCPYEIVHEGLGYRLALRKTFDAVRNKFYGRVREARLSQAAIDILAIVAYRQPLSGEKISELRGKSSSHILSQLVHRQLLRIERSDDRKAPRQYYTTDRFLDLFALESLVDLPQTEDLDA